MEAHKGFYMAYDYEDEIKDIMIEYGIDRVKATKIFLGRCKPGEDSADPYTQMERENRLYGYRNNEED
jgi:hypothetical protein